MKKFSVKTGVLLNKEDKKETEVCTVVEAETFSVRDDGVLILKNDMHKPVASFNKEEWISCVPVKDDA